MIFEADKKYELTKKNKNIPVFLAIMRWQKYTFTSWYVDFIFYRYLINNFLHKFVWTILEQCYFNKLYLLIMFTTGRIIFTVAFVLVFVGAIIYSYRKDLKVSRQHYKGSIWILLFILLIFSTLFLIVKFRHWKKSVTLQSYQYCTTKNEKFTINFFSDV